jgi:FAD/FMN-containing dehydrogenase
VSAAADGFHHPATEQELIDLVRAAHREGRGLRVRGSAHSVAHAIYADPLDEFPNRVNQKTRPRGESVNVMLDRYRGWRVKDEASRLVEADAGIHLGADPGDPTKTATLEASLLAQLAAEKGWTLSNTGGITRQTISGFTATGSSGGSVRFSSNDDLHGFRVIDGTGEVHDLTRDDEDFFAMAPSLGLLGVVSTITFECTELFAIEGQESVEALDDCAVDLVGRGDGRPSLERFLRDTDFARLEWWPQRGVERVVAWQARRIAPPPGFAPDPYERFASSPEAAQQLIGVLFAILGNLDDLSKAKDKLEDSFDELKRVLEALPAARGLGAPGKVLADFLARAIEFGVDAAITVLQPFAPLIRRELPDFFPRLMRAFIPLGEPQRFSDWGWRGLPMDNGVSDILVPTEFTEAWIPLPRTQETMALLHAHFSEPDEDAEAYRRTGTYVWELYAAKPSRFWLSPSYTAGDDEWRDGAFRVDPYWFADSAGNPAETFFAGLWELLREHDIPFRLHWGKFQPVHAPGDRTWVDYFRTQYPRWDDFLRLRAERDPNNIFLTGYWRDRFGLWDEPAPRARS